MITLATIAVLAALAWALTRHRHADSRMFRLKGGPFGDSVDYTVCTKCGRTERASVQMGPRADEPAPAVPSRRILRAWRGAGA